MKQALKTFPVLLATPSMKNAKDPANTVPNPLFRPLHKVAPAAIKPFVNMIDETTAGQDDDHDGSYNSKKNLC